MANNFRIKEADMKEREQFKIKEVNATFTKKQILPRQQEQS